MEIDFSMTCFPSPDVFCELTKNRRGWKTKKWKVIMWKILSVSWINWSPIEANLEEKLVNFLSGPYFNWATGILYNFSKQQTKPRIWVRKFIEYSVYTKAIYWLWRCRGRTKLLWAKYGIDGIVLLGRLFCFQNEQKKMHVVYSE